MKNVKNAFVHELPFFFCLPALLWQVFFLFIPFGIIIVFSFTRYAGVSWTPQFTVDHYAALMSAPYVFIVVRSIILAMSTAIISLFLAYPVAYFLALRVKRAKNLLLFLLTLPFWTNFLIQVYAWFFLIERNGIINKLLLMFHIIDTPLYLSGSLAMVFLVMVYCYLPFMIMPLYSTLTKINRGLLEASSDLGATRWQTFSKITLPLSVPGIRTGLLLVLVPAFGEFAIPALVGGSKYMFTGSLISYFFLVARNNAQGAAFTIFSGILLLFVIIVLSFLVTHILFARGRK